MADEAFYRSNHMTASLKHYINRYESFEEFEKEWSDELLNEDARIGNYLDFLLIKYDKRAAAVSKDAGLAFQLWLPLNERFQQVIVKHTIVNQNVCRSVHQTLAVVILPQLVDDVNRCHPLYMAVVDGDDGRYMEVGIQLFRQFRIAFPAADGISNERAPPLHLEHTVQVEIYQ